MTLSHTPTPARSDVASTVRGAVSPARPYFVHGRVLSIGALMWAGAILLVGNDPSGSTDLVLFGVGSGAFQIGLLFLLRVLWRTQALGEGKLARGVLRFEAFAVCMAIASTFVDAIGVSDLEQTGWLVLDLFWPLSMMGMFFIGIRIAIAGRWSGLSRWWPMVAESWAVVVIPTLGIFGADVAKIVAALHLIVGYNVLGVLVSRKQ